MLLMLDNYDSFTYNLVHLFQELGAEVRVFRNDAITADEAEALAPDASRHLPRPGPPRGRGRVGRADPAPRPDACRRSASASATRRSSRRSAARSARRTALVHGKASPVEHDGQGVFAGLPDAVRGRAATTRSRRRASPTSSRSPPATPDGEVMGVRHRELPIEGVQFHPESVLTPLGPADRQNFLERR